MGPGDVWDGTRDVKYRDAGTIMNIAKVGGKCDTSLFVKMCYLDLYDQH